VPEPVRRPVLRSISEEGSFCEGGCLCGYEPIMQNKANLLNVQMNVTIVLTKYYENKRLCRRSEKQTQTKPICWILK